jgi:hypothetical protein
MARTIPPAADGDCARAVQIRPADTCQLHRILAKTVLTPMRRRAEGPDQGAQMRYPSRDRFIDDLVFLAAPHVERPGQRPGLPLAIN